MQLCAHLGGTSHAESKMLVATNPTERDDGGIGLCSYPHQVRRIRPKELVLFTFAWHDVELKICI